MVLYTLKNQGKLSWPQNILNMQLKNIPRYILTHASKHMNARCICRKSPSFYSFQHAPVLKISQQTLTKLKAALKEHQSKGRALIGHLHPLNNKQHHCKSQKYSHLN